jgi:glycosyltransferase involved in cell wall biosynthesis
LRIEYSLRVYQKIRELAAKEGLDIVEGPNFSAETFIYSLFKKAPLVIRLHTHFSMVIASLGLKNGLDNSLSCWLENGNILRSDMVVSSTRNHARIVFAQIGSYPRNSRIISLGVPLPALNDGHQINKNPVVLFVGRLERRKGIGVLLEAIPYVLKEFPLTVFNIVGREAGEKIPIQSSKNIVFLGHLETDRLSEYYRRCDIFTVPSLYESCGLVYLEAMAYGKPVIGSEAGGIPEIIQNNYNGLLVPVGDARSLAEAIIRLLLDNDLRKRLGDNARLCVENNFTSDKMVRRSIELYQSLIKEKK